MTDYAAPELLVDTAWLVEHLGGPGMQIVEMAQDATPFPDGHIPGAIVAPDWQIKGSANQKIVAPPEEAKAWLESVGIGDDTLVIVYDRSRNRDAARLWWVLKYYGFTNIKVLNGGWVKWEAEGRPVEQGASRVAPGATFTPKSPDRAIESTVDKLKAAIGEPDQIIWDIRSPDEFSGANDRGNARKGHVPGAVLLEWTELVNEDHTFKPADELRTMLEALGITPDSTVHIY
jgi:thiosulfate/3-mercaptopyruvate sulfurtransferase